MYHLRKKHTRKLKRKSGKVNKKYNKKRVTKRIKLNRKKLKRRTSKRRRNIKGGSEVPESEDIGVGGSRCMAGGNAHEDEQDGGMNPYLFSSMQRKRGGNPDEEGPVVGGNSNEDEQMGGMYGYKRGGKKRRQHGGNGCPCGSV